MELHHLHGVAAIGRWYCAHLGAMGRTPQNATASAAPLLDVNRLTPHTYLTQLRLKAAIRNLRAGRAGAEATVAAA
jgi:hypothetical protein